MIYGYCRCSTNETRQDINRQRRELKKLGATDEHIYMEYESGTKVNRPELQKLLSIVQSGDTIVATEVSRITRSTRQLCDIIALCKERNLKLIIQNSVTIDCSSGEIDPMSEAFLQMAGVFSQLERNITVSRIKSGLRNARAKGVRLGRPKVTMDKLPKKVIEQYENWKNGVINKSDYAKICGISRPTLDKYIAIMTDG